jgi:hypothetical protein
MSFFRSVSLLLAKMLAAGPDINAIPRRLFLILLANLQTSCHLVLSVLFYNTSRDLGT